MMPTFRMSKEEEAEFERQCLARGGTVTPIDRSALLPEERASKPAKGRKPAMVEPSFESEGRWLEAVLPVETSSEVNQRAWKARQRRTGQAWNAVSRLFGQHLYTLAAFSDHYHLGGALRVTFVRLGGKKLDRSNLPTATKAVEDALAFLIGASDGDPRWQAAWDQEPGGAVGVRIRLEVIR